MFGGILKAVVGVGDKLTGGALSKATGALGSLLKGDIGGFLKGGLGLGLSLAAMGATGGLGALGGQLTKLFGAEGLGILAKLVSGDLTPQGLLASLGGGNADAGAFGLSGLAAKAQGLLGDVIGNSSATAQQKDIARALLASPELAGLLGLGSKP